MAREQQLPKPKKDPLPTPPPNRLVKGGLNPKPQPRPQRKPDFGVL